MIVDDNIETLKILNDLLVTMNVSVAKFDNARAAAQHYSNNPNYDLVITDFNMDGKNGEGLIFDIKYANPNQKIFLLTGDSGNLNLPEDFKVLVFQKGDGIKPIISAIHEIFNKNKLPKTKVG